MQKAIRCLTRNIQLLKEVKSKTYVHLSKELCQGGKSPSLRKTSVFVQNVSPFIFSLAAHAQLNGLSAVDISQDAYGIHTPFLDCPTPDILSAQYMVSQPLKMLDYYARHDIW